MSFVSGSNDLLENAILTTWLEIADVGICVIDKTSTVVMLNSVACTMLSIDGLQVLNKPFVGLLQGLINYGEAIAWLGKQTIVGERHFQRRVLGQAQHLLMRGQNIKIASGDQYRIVSITDISKVIEAQEIEIQHRQWQAVNAGVVISDARLPDMPIVYVNTFFEQMSGYSLAEIKGRNCRFLQGEDTQQEGVAALRQAIAAQTNGYAVLRNYRKDGSMFLNELFISPLRDSEGQVNCFLGVQHLRTQSHTLGLGV